MKMIFNTKKMNRKDFDNEYGASIQNKYIGLFNDSPLCGSDNFEGCKELIQDSIVEDFTSGLYYESGKWSKDNDKEIDLYGNDNIEYTIIEIV